MYLFPCQSAPAITKQIKKAKKAADLLISLLHIQGETTFLEGNHQLKDEAYLCASICSSCGPGVCSPSCERQKDENREFTPKL